MKAYLARRALVVLLAPITGSAQPLTEPEAAPPDRTDPPEQAASAEASAVTYVAEGGRVVALQNGVRTPLGVPAPVRAVHLEGSILYVARAEAGVVVYDVSSPLEPRLLREVALGGGSADGFHTVEGQVWVVVASRSAIPLGSVTASALPVQETSSGGVSAGSLAPSPGTALAKETELSERSIALRRVAPGTIELSIGADENVRVGDRFAVFRATSVREGSATGFMGEELITIAEVTAVKGDRALAEVGRSAVIEKGDFARRAKTEQSESLIFPQRVSHVGEVTVVLRPLINAGRPLGAGFLADVEAAYWGEAYFFDLRLQPLGLGWTDDGNIVSTAALVEGGYDGRALAVGVGAGVSWVNGNMDTMLAQFGRSGDDSSAPGEPQRQERQSTSSAFTVSQVVRLGARDGLNLQVYNLLLLHKDTESRESGFIYGGTSARLLIPVARRSDLLFEGGGGLMGYWFVGGGVSSWIVGNGAPGSWKLSVSAGAAGILGNREVTESYMSEGQAYSYTYDEDVDIAGPMVSVGLTRRFGF